MFDYILLAIIIFVAAFSKGLSGFSFALIAISFLPNLFNLDTVVALISLLQLISTITLCLYYRANLNFKLVARLIVASVVGVPIGIFLLKNIDQFLMLKFLGTGIIIYSLYHLIYPDLPKLILPQWAYVFGFISGVFSGAYNLSGPPVVIYANSTDWNIDEFKSNILSAFLLTEIITVMNRFVSQSVTPPVWQLFFIAITPLFLGMFTGGASHLCKNKCTKKLLKHIIEISTPMLKYLRNIFSFPLCS